MTTPLVIEMRPQLEPVAHDPFIDEARGDAFTAARAAAWPWPTRRPTDA